MEQNNCVAGVLKKLDLILPLNNDEKCLQEARKMVLILRSDWEDNGLQHEFFTEGITNRILSVWHNTSGSDDRILIRIFGEKTEYVIDRCEEMKNMQLLENNGCAAPLLCEFSNGLVYKYVPGVVLDEETVREERIATAVAKAMVKQHLINTPTNCGEVVPCIFHKAGNYISNMPSSFEKPEKQRRFSETFPKKETILLELKRISETVERLNSPIVLCHNDLLLKNIVYDKEKDCAFFIDYEYAGFNYQAFDIADHFSEFAGVSEDMDYERLFPSKEFQLDWLKTYLEFWHKANGYPAPTDKDVEILYVQVNKFVPLAHFFWSFWACIQAAHSTIDFDFLEYGIARWKEYLRTKELFAGLELPLG